MQRTQIYSGTLADIGDVRTRLVSYGHTLAYSQYDGKTDFINSTFASFLVSCGVDAAYEQRANDDEKWLYIWDIPFLAFSSGGNTMLGMWGPDNYRVQPSLSQNSYYRGYGIDVWNGASYNFAINFVGSPVNGFCLRLINPSNMTAAYAINGTTSSSSNYTLILRMIRCTNMTNGNDAVAYAAGVFYPYLYACESYTSRDIVNGVMESNYSNNYGRFYGDTTPNQKSVSGNKMPLLPVIFGTRITNGVYQNLSNYNIPGAINALELTQAEVTLGGHTFVNTQYPPNTTRESDLLPNHTGINMGLIDTTNDP